MNEPTRYYEDSLLRTGSRVRFHIVDKYIAPIPESENIFVRADLLFQGDGEEGTGPADVVMWAAFPFLFTIATLSFDDAKPDGFLDQEFRPNDKFTGHDFLERLTFGGNGLTFKADYIRGRCMKIDVAVRPDGIVTLSTWGLGKSALRWLDTFQGKKLMAVVSPDGESEKR